MLPALNHCSCQRSGGAQTCSSTASKPTFLAQCWY